MKREREAEIKALTDDYNHKLELIQSDKEKEVDRIFKDSTKEMGEKDHKIDSLVKQVKSFTDTQYHALNDLEIVKRENSKLLQRLAETDERVLGIKNSYQSDMDKMTQKHRKEKDEIIKNYQLEIQNLQKMHEEITSKYNGTLQVLSSSKKEIQNLTTNKDKLESAFNHRNTNYDTIQQELDQLKTEYEMVTEKLKKSNNLNNTLAEREKVLSNQLRSFQDKFRMEQNKM
jgi:chromosome segregation ATPase